MTNAELLDEINKMIEKVEQLDKTEVGQAVGIRGMSVFLYIYQDKMITKIIKENREDWAYSI